MIETVGIIFLKDHQGKKLNENYTKTLNIQNMGLKLKEWYVGDNNCLPGYDGISESS